MRPPEPQGWKDSATRSACSVDRHLAAAERPTEVAVHALDRHLEQARGRARPGLVGAVRRAVERGAVRLQLRPQLAEPLLAPRLDGEVDELGDVRQVAVVRSAPAPPARARAASRRAPRGGGAVELVPGRLVLAVDGLLGAQQLGDAPRPLREQLVDLRRLDRQVPDERDRVVVPALGDRALDAVGRRLRLLGPGAGAHRTADQRPVHELGVTARRRLHAGTLDE